MAMKAERWQFDESAVFGTQLNRCLLGVRTGCMEKLSRTSLRKCIMGGSMCLGIQADGGLEIIPCSRYFGSTASPADFHTRRTTGLGVKSGRSPQWSGLVGSRNHEMQGSVPRCCSGCACRSLVQALFGGWPPFRKRYSSRNPRDLDAGSTEVLWR